MTDPLSAASIATLIFTTAVSKLTEALTEDARTQLGQKLQALKQLLSNKFQCKAKSALASADKGDDAAIGKVSSYLDIAMDEDDDFAQQVRALAQEIQQVTSINQVQGQNVQNVVSGEGNQANSTDGQVIMGGIGHKITIHN